MVDVKDYRHARSGYSDGERCNECTYFRKWNSDVFTCHMYEYGHPCSFYKSFLRKETDVPYIGDGYKGKDTYCCIKCACCGTDVSFYRECTTNLCQSCMDTLSDDEKEKYS